VLDRSCDYKTRAGTTHGLEVKRQGDVSDHGCEFKTRVDMTYGLEVEREGVVSDRRWD
jgi:hypothetical protein